jgi:hypothetical protein
MQVSGWKEHVIHSSLPVRSEVYPEFIQSAEDHIE